MYDHREVNYVKYLAREKKVDDENKLVSFVNMLSKTQKSFCFLKKTCIHVCGSVHACGR